jgi:alpha-tubulin suppressor-like RCC1 family protein
MRNIVTYKINKNLFFCLFLIFSPVLLISCSELAGPEVSCCTGPGQLETDLDYAVLKPDGTIWTWGNNLTGVLGNGTLSPRSTPGIISGIKEITALRLREGIAIASDTKGNIWFWGNRFIWEEPPGTDIDITRPAKISFLRNVKKLVIGGIYAFLLKNDGTIWKIELDHNNPSKFLTPELIPEMKNIASISGELALTFDGRLIEFPGTEFVGSDWGALSDTLEIRDVTAIENMARSYSIIIKKDSTVWAWGINNGGVLGNDSMAVIRVPVRVGNLDHITSISAEGSRCLALRSDGSVWFWGLRKMDSRNHISIYQSTPTKIEGVNNAQIVHASTINKCLILTKDGTYMTLDLETMTVEKLNGL